jgi:hypothetical protein
MRSGKRKEGMKLNLPPKFMEKTSLSPVISFCKSSFPVKHLMPLIIPKLANRLTLGITLSS